MRHVMVDIETLGTRPGSVILSIGACQFDETGIGELFYRPVDVLDSLLVGLTVDQATIGWWRMQSPEAKGALKPGVPLLDALNAFASFLVSRPGDEPPRKVWAKGPDFDLVMLAAAYKVLDGVRLPWHYRDARDVRTILALAPGTSVTVGNNTKHHALDDAVFQAEQVRQAASVMGVTLSEMA